MRMLGWKNFKEIAIVQNTVMPHDAFFIGNVIEKRTPEIETIAIMHIQNQATAHNVEFVFAEIADFHIEIGTCIVQNGLKAFRIIEGDILERNRYGFDFVFCQRGRKQIG